MSPPVGHFIIEEKINFDGGQKKLGRKQGVEEEWSCLGGGYYRNGPIKFYIRFFLWEGGRVSLYASEYQQDPTPSRKGAYLMMMYNFSLWIFCTRTELLISRIGRKIVITRIKTIMYSCFLQYHFALSQRFQSIDK